MPPVDGLPQVRFFSRLYRCITYSYRGFPPTEVPEHAEDYSQELLLEDLPKNSGLNDVEIEIDFPRVGRKRLVLNARRISANNKQSPLYLLAMEDVTEREGPK